MRNKFLLLFGRRSSLLQQVGQAHRIVGASFPSHGNFPLDNRSGPCYDRQRGLDIPDVSPEGNPLPRRPEFEPSAGRPSLFPIEGGHILCGRGGMADAPDLGSGAERRMSSSLFARTTRFFCGSSSVGRASPCQGEGRESESRLPLHVLYSRAFARLCTIKGMVP